MDAYIEIDGKRAKLTEEQLKALGLEPARKSAFKRCDGRQVYYFISGAGNICERYDNKYDENERHHKVGNYCTDKELMKQRALHETLNRLLWRYSMEHGGDEIDWSDEVNPKWKIAFDYCQMQLKIYDMPYHEDIGVIYFHTKEIAKNAIKEIIEPFIAEHPEFEW